MPHLMLWKTNSLKLGSNESSGVSRQEIYSGSLASLMERTFLYQAQGRPPSR